MQEQYVRYYSSYLGRDLEMLVFGHSGFPVVLFPTAEGRYFEHKDMEMIEAVKWFLHNGVVKIYCPDTINGMSWLNSEVSPADRVRNHILYDKLLNDELVPNIMEETGCSKVAAAGCGFGGYHAANLAFKHPEKVSHLFSMGGFFDVRHQLDGFYNEDIYFNNPVDFLPGSNHPDLWQMKIILGTSDQDLGKHSNIQMSEILRAKGIDHWLDIRQGEQGWEIWREMLPHYLSLM